MKKTLIVMMFVLGCVIGAASAYAGDLLNEVAVAHSPQDNKYMVAYAGSGNQMKCRLVNAAGQTTGGELTVTTAICRNPSIAYDSDTDKFLVAWGEMGSGDYAIKCRLVTSGCQLSGNEITLASGLSAWPSPKVVYSSNSQRYLVVYTIFTAIQAQFILSDGSLDGSAFAAIPGDSHAGFSYADSPALVFDSVNNRYLLAALTFGGSYPPMSLSGAVLDDDDDPSVLAGPFSILDAGTFLYPPALAFDYTNERFLAVWEVYTGSGHELWGQLINAGGSLYGANWKISEDRYVSFANDVTYKEADDRYLVAWLDDENSPLEIHAQEVDSDGANYGDEFTLAAPAYQYDLALAYNPVSENTLLVYRNAGNLGAHGFVVTPEVATADMSIELSGQDKAIVDESLTYTITITNSGDDDAPGVTVTIDVPDGASFLQAVPSQGTCDYDNSTVTCDLGYLENGGDATVALDIMPTELGVITTTATVTSDVLDTNAANNSDSKETLIRRNLDLSLSEGTTGTEIEIAGEGFGTKKGKVFLLGSGKPVSLKVLSWNEAGSGVIRALISKAPPAGVYDVSVVPTEPKGAAAIIEEDGFEIMAPEITACPGSGYSEQSLTMSGNYFGTKKGKIYIEYDDDNGRLKRKSCKVLSWPLDSDAGTESGTIQFIVPKGMPEGDWSLIVQNKVDEASMPFEVRGEAP